MAKLEHKDLIDPGIHEPKDIGAALADQVYTADGAGKGAWKSPRAAALFEQTVDVTVVNTTVETTLLGTGLGSKTVPAGLFVPGAHFKLRCQGILTDNATPSFTLRFKANGIEFASTGPQTLGAVVDDHWVILLDGVIRSVGVTGSIMVSGGFLTSKNDHFPLVALGVQTLDTTVDQTFEMTAEWSAADALNKITNQICTVEVI